MVIVPLVYKLFKNKAGSGLPATMAARDRYSPSSSTKCATTGCPNMAVSSTITVLSSAMVETAANAAALVLPAAAFFNISCAAGWGGGRKEADEPDT